MIAGRSRRPWRTPVESLLSSRRPLQQIEMDAGMEVAPWTRGKGVQTYLGFSCSTKYLSADFKEKTLDAFNILFSQNIVHSLAR